MLVQRNNCCKVALRYWASCSTTNHRKKSQPSVCIELWKVKETGMFYHISTHPTKLSSIFLDNKNNTTNNNINNNNNNNINNHRQQQTNNLQLLLSPTAPAQKKNNPTCSLLGGKAGGLGGNFLARRSTFRRCIWGIWVVKDVWKIHLFQ